MEIIETLNQYYFFSHIEETPAYFFIYTKANILVQYGQKDYHYKVSFKINKKNFNLKRIQPKLVFDKKKGDYDYVFIYTDRDEYGKKCCSINQAIKYITNFFKQGERNLEWNI